jgi:hypothetical protein
MKLCCILGIIGITALVKSSSAGFIVELGLCIGSNGSNETLYGHAYLSGRSTSDVIDIDAVIAWCLTATAYVPSLVGVVMGVEDGVWGCLYDNGSIDDMEKGDFNPPVEDIWTDGNASGAIVGTIGKTSYLCLKNLVCKINSNGMISFLIL